MTTGTERNKRLIGLFLLGYILFNFPLLSLFDLPRMVLGYPLLYAYIFCVWVLLIILVIMIFSARPPSS